MARKNRGDFKRDVKKRAYLPETYGLRHGFIMKTFKRYSLAMRLWHWLDALVVLGLLGTFFLRETLLSVSVNRVLLQQKLAEHQVSIPDDLAKDLAGIAIDRLWDWHVKLGYMLGALLLVRLVLFVFERPSIFSEAWTGLRSRDRDFRSLHNAGVKSLYALFYLAQALMVATGLSMVFSEPLGLTEATGHLFGELHENVMWFFAFFVVVHIVGVVVAENTTDPGLVSNMVNGGGKQT